MLQLSIKYKRKKHMHFNRHRKNIWQNPICISVKNSQQTSKRIELFQLDKKHILKSIAST